MGGIECKGDEVNACLWSSNAANFGYLRRGCARESVSTLFGREERKKHLPQRRRDSLGKARLDSRVAEVILRSRARLDVLPRIVVPERFLVRHLCTYMRVSQSFLVDSCIRIRGAHISVAPALLFPLLDLTQPGASGPVSPVRRLQGLPHSQMGGRPARRAALKVALARRLTAPRRSRPRRRHRRGRENGRESHPLLALLCTLLCGYGGD